ncbi:flagellin [Cryobacterium sp. Y11]|uniref:flagellin N-terminal helical domain-containing protein n=1 Tax=Cryobacterium sp. Y11 TaxID=2045016 RepID=UPI000CE5062C|nr:flagellin [Cryobacterium sp. Y11]
MGMQVNTNIAANNAYRNLATTQNDLSKSLEKLSSGLRINRAADDAAGLAISEGLKSQVGGLTVASRNAQDAISVIQTAEGSLNEVTSILQRMRDLAVQAGNDSNSAQSRNAISTEVTALHEELVRIKDSTNFNGTKLLDGPNAAGTSILNFQIGADGNSASQMSVDLESSDIGEVANALKFGTTVGEALSFDLADANLSTIRTAIADDASYLDDAGTGPADAKITFTTGNQDVNVFLDGTARTDVELAAALNANEDFSRTYSATNEPVLVDGEPTGATTLVIARREIDPESNGSDLITTVAFQTGAQIETAAAGTTGSPVMVRDDVLLGFNTAAEAQASITAIDEQITAVSTARAELGSYQNRFESVIKNLAVSKENLTAAGSRIRDTDMAEEMVKYTRANILSQAGTAMLAQANQSNQGVLQLLQ